MSRRLPPLVLLLLAGSGLLSALRFMVLPFFALFLRLDLGTSPATIGFVVGLGALAGLASAPILGPLSDRRGRKPMLLAGTVTTSLAIAALAAVHSLVAFALLNVVMGAAFGLEGTSYQALLTDLTPEESRARVFGYSYWTANVGAAVGPLLGTLAGAGRTVTPFLIAGAASLVLAILFYFLLPGSVGRAPSAHGSTRASLGHLLEGLRIPILAGFLVGVFFASTAYSQVSTNLAEFLGSTYADGPRLYAVVIATNAAAVLVLQPFLSRWQERRPLLWSLLAGTAIYVVTSAVFSLDQAWLSWIATMVAFTIGEVLLSPSQQAIIAAVAPADRRATYFTLLSVSWSLASFVGPLVGGVALGFGRLPLFLLMAGSNALALLTYLLTLTRDPRLSRSPGREVTPPASP